MFPDDFSYVAYPIEDSHDSDPSQYFEDLFTQLTKVKEDKQLALIHCTTGKNIGTRSDGQQQTILIRSLTIT